MTTSHLSLVPHLQPGWRCPKWRLLYIRKCELQTGQLDGSCLDFMILFLLVWNFLRHNGCGRHIWNMENTGASSIICVNYLYLPKFVCLIVSCLITQVKQYVTIRRKKNTIRALSIDRDKIPPERVPVLITRTMKVLLLIGNPYPSSSSHAKRFIFLRWDEGWAAATEVEFLAEKMQRYSPSVWWLPGAHQQLQRKKKAYTKLTSVCRCFLFWPFSLVV